MPTMIDPSTGSGARLGARGSRLLVVLFLILTFSLSSVTAYLIHRGKMDPVLQNRLEEIRKMITPGQSR